MFDYWCNVWQCQGARHDALLTWGASNAELWYMLCCTPEQALHTVDATTIMWRQNNVTVYCCWWDVWIVVWLQVLDYPHREPIVLWDPMDTEWKWWYLIAGGSHGSSYIWPFHWSLSHPTWYGAPKLRPARTPPSIHSGLPARFTYTYTDGMLHWSQW